MATRFEHARPDDYLTRLAASDLGRSYKAFVASLMSIQPGSVVLDLGCGPGTDLAAFADATGPGGSVIGLDGDEDAVQRACLSAQDRPTIAVRPADIHRLDLPDGSVDRAHTDRVLQHVAVPGDVLREVRRVLVSGGRAVFAEPDWDTLVVDYPETRVASAYRAFITERVVRNARIGRQLPRLAEQVGLSVERVVPFTTVFRDAGDADAVFGFRRVTGRAVDAGYLGTGEAEAWLDYLMTQPFLASVTMFVVVTEAP